jgi:hypothetical protein
MVDFNGRNAAGEILNGSTSIYAKENAQDFQRYLSVKAMSQEEKENAGFILEKYQGQKNLVTKYINDYFKYMMSSDWFLYKQIKGDLTYGIYAQNYTIPGGLNMVVQKKTYYTLNSISDNAEKDFSAGRFIDAANKYGRTKALLSGPHKKWDKEDFKTGEFEKLDSLVEISLTKADSLTKYLMTWDALNSMKKYSAKDLSGDLGKEFGEIISTVELHNNPLYSHYQSFTRRCLSDLEVAMQNYIQKRIDNRVLFEREMITTSIYNGNVHSKKGTFYSDMTRDTLDKRLNRIGRVYLNKIKYRLQRVKSVELKIEQIENLNRSKPTKYIYNESKIILKEILTDYAKMFPESSDRQGRVYKNGESIDYFIKFYTRVDQKLTEIDSSLDKIISIYSGETKPIDKLLKKAQTKEDKRVILFK